MTNLIKRDYYPGSSDDFKRNFFSRPLKEWVKLTLLLLKIFSYRLVGNIFLFLVNRNLVKNLTFARKIHANFVSWYIPGYDYFEIQIGNQTRSSVIIKQGEAFRFTKKIEENDSFVFGISPLIDELNQVESKKWSFVLTIKNLDDNKTETFEGHFPYNGISTSFAYFPGNGWVDIKHSLTDYVGLNCTIEITPVIHCHSRKQQNTQNIFSISSPQIVKKNILQSKKNVLLISLESLTEINFLKRKYGLGDLPALDALSSESTVYPRVYSPTENTLSFAASILTGLLPSQHAIGNYSVAASAFNNKIYNEQLTSLPTLFKKMGFLTFYGGSTTRFSSKIGWGRGFDNYFHILEQWKPGVPGFDWITRTFAALPEFNKFIYSHIDFLHDPLVSFRDSDLPVYHNLNLLHSTREGKIDQLYMNQLIKLDQYLGRLISNLKTTGMYDHTAIIITGDHGNGINWVKHAENALYEERIRVPLIVKYPSWAQKDLKIKKITNSVTEIYQILHHLLNMDLPLDVSQLPQYSTYAGKMAFSETIMNPKRDYKRYNLAIMSDKYKYLCWNHIDWDHYSIIKNLKDCLHIWDENIQSYHEAENIIETDKKAANEFQNLATQLIETNLKFLSRYAPQRY